MSLVTYWNTCCERGSQAFGGRHTLPFVKLMRRRSLWRRRGWRAAEQESEFVSPFESQMQPNTCGLGAGCVRKDGFWDTLLTNVMAPSKELDLQERRAVTRSVGMGHPQKSGLEMPEVHLSRHAEYRILCDNHHQLQINLGRLWAAGLPTDLQALLCWFRLTHVLSSRAASLYFLAINTLLEVFSPALLWCCDHKGALSVRHNFYRRRREPLHPFPAKDRSFPLKVTLGDTERGSVPLPLCPLLLLGRFFPHSGRSKSHVTAEVLPSNRTEPQPLGWGFWSSLWGVGWLQRSSTRPVQRKCGKNLCPLCLKHCTGTMPIQIFGLRFAIPPSESQYVISKHLIRAWSQGLSALLCAHSWLSPGKGQPGRDVSWEVAPWRVLEPIYPFHRWSTLMGQSIFWGKAAQSHTSVGEGQQRVKVFRPLQPHQSYSPFLFSFISDHFHQGTHSHPFP